MSTGCRICDDKVLRRAVDEEIAKGLAYAGTARLMTARGFPLSPTTVSSHVNGRHKEDYAPVPAAATVSKRDAAAIIKNRLLDAIEADPDLDILDRDVQSALSTALKAQGLEDKREQKKVTQNFWLSVGAGLQGVSGLLEDSNTIEGTAVEVG